MNTGSLEYVARDDALDRLVLATIVHSRERRRPSPAMVAAEEAREQAIEDFVRTHAKLVEYERRKAARAR
jgi:hypothetical protein